VTEGGDTMLGFHKTVDSAVGSDPHEVESLASALYDDLSVTEVIRPAAVLSASAASLVTEALRARDVNRGGRWHVEPGCWKLYEQPWERRDRNAANTGVIGSIQVAYGTPTRYEITIFRATITLFGVRHGWSVNALCDEALSYAGLTLATCPRADVTPPPKPFRMR
jgi:hypothetical protein